MNHTDFEKEVKEQIEELIRLGIFRDLRCPKCNSDWVTTISVFEELGRHRCLSCGAEFTDEDLEENENVQQD